MSDEDPSRVKRAKLPLTKQQIAEIVNKEKERVTLEASRKKENVRFRRLSVDTVATDFVTRNLCGDNYLIKYV